MNVEPLKPKKVNISYCVSIHSINIGLLGVSVAVILGAIVIRKCNINTIRSIFLWIRVSLVKSISKRINLKSLCKSFHTRTILSGAGLRGLCITVRKSKWVREPLVPTAIASSRATTNPVPWRRGTKPNMSVFWASKWRTSKWEAVIQSSLSTEIQPTNTCGEM